MTRSWRETLKALRRALGTLLALAVLVVASIWAMSVPPLAVLEEEFDTSDTTPVVSVIEATPKDWIPTLQAFGTVSPEFSTTLASEVEGVVREVAPSSFSGKHLTKGEIAITIDDSRQRTRLATAEAALQQAQVALIDEKLRGEQALVDWGRSGAKGDPPPFVAREPQLLAAQRNLADVQAARDEALRNVERALVRAPFAAAVTRRLVAPGAYVQPGTSLLELFGTERFEVRLPLSPREWRLLPQTEQLVAESWPVHLSSSDGQDRWEGRVTRVERHVNTITRQRAIVVTIDNPLDQKAPLLPGTFVRATFAGRKTKSMLAVPASALTARGDVWYVSTTGTLARKKVDPIASVDGQHLIPALHATDPIQILVHPMLSYLPGLKVRANPVEARDD